MEIEMNFEEFVEVLSSMSDYDFASFLNFYAEENGIDYQVLYLHLVNNRLDWIGYYAEECGYANDENSALIINEILKHVSYSDYMIYENNNFHFVKKEELFNFCKLSDIIKKIYQDEKSWKQKYINGYPNVTYDYFVNHSVLKNEIY